MRSQTWTPLPPPSPKHLSGSSPCTSPKHAAPYVRHGLAIQLLHDSIHVRIPILPNHPTISLSHRVQKSVQYICVSSAVSHTRLSLPSFWIPYICVSILYWCFSFWLTSLCIIGSSFIHLIRTDSNVFFLFFFIFKKIFNSYMRSQTWTPLPPPSP